MIRILPDKFKFKIPDDDELNIVYSAEKSNDYKNFYEVSWSSPIDGELYKLNYNISLAERYVNERIWEVIKT